MYGGFNTRYQHDSKACACKMTFTVYFPPAAATEKVPVSPVSHQYLPLSGRPAVPPAVDELQHANPRLPAASHPLHAPASPQVIYYLSGLTCTDENVIQKVSCCLLASTPSSSGSSLALFVYLPLPPPILL